MFYWKNKIRNSVCFVFAVIAGCFVSCEKRNIVTVNYFPVDSLIKAQVVHLDTSNAKLTKFGFFDDKNDTASYMPPDSLAWANELSALDQLSAINKPIYSGNYIIENGLKDTRSNLTILQYTAKPDQELAVPYLRIFYHGNLSNIRKIEGAYDETNALYKSKQIISIEMQNLYNKNVVTSYTIEGGQKMVLADTTYFSVNTRINFK
jgi:hypothetical protein